MKKIIIVLFLVLFLVACKPKITNFDECIAAGNPAMESYPRQCAANGKTFTEVIEEPVVDEPVVDEPIEETETQEELEDEIQEEVLEEIEAEEDETEDEPGTGTLVMQITDKKPELNINSLMITISDIKVHSAGTGGTTEEVCTNETEIVEDCRNETTTEIIPECVNVTTVVENCSFDNATNSTICVNETTVEENCTDVEINTTVETCVNETIEIETCSNEEESGEGWFTVVTGPKTYDLIQIQDVKELLGDKVLTVGKYTQIRLTIDEAELEIDDDYVDFKIPCGRIKLVKNFDIKANETTTLTLDFDAQKSVHKAGSKYIMKPTIKIITE